ncbi:G-protein coupled receptor family C group 5 member C-like [Hoplias malabaricus]|uniref:G-protein coupled receptor family C group 5 member C-like n=1 Tax=Hoplias malabaricus TaxID=27720 RepID=UPI0034617CBB
MKTSSIPPEGCPSSLDSRYFTFCDLTAVWGIVVEAVAGAGIVTSLLLLVVTALSLPFVEDNKKSMLTLQTSFQMFTLGHFGVSLVFLMGPDSITCTARMFVFGVLFAGNFACLVMHGLWLVLDPLGKRLRGWPFWLGALGLWLIEVIINTEWMMIVLQMPQDTAAVFDVCDISQTDFTMALIYVMVLLVVVVIMAVPSLSHKHMPFRCDALYILLTGILSVCVWMGWIVMYIYINNMLARPSWDDATLAIALVFNAWIFLMTYSIPEFCALIKDMETLEVSLDTSKSNITSDHTNSQEAIGVENENFSSNDRGKCFISPYCGYFGSVHKNVYQATELAFISQGPVNDISHEEVPTRPTAPVLLPETSSHLPN